MQIHAREAPVHAMEQLLVALGRPEPEPPEDAGRSGDASPDLHHDEASHSDDLRGEQGGHRDGHRPRRLVERQGRHGESGGEEDGLPDHHRGLVHDHRGEPFVERQPAAYEVCLEGLAAHRGRWRQQIRGLARQARRGQCFPRDAAAGQEHAPAERVESDGHAVREEYEEREPPGQGADGLPHRGGPQIPDEPCDEAEADREEQRPQEPAAHELPMARRKRSRISSGL